ncbi:protein strawberry notch homolog 1 isoform X2 [Hyalella azteca]|uniref:Protein strawberry notch homolog 1 isoform X2 n=1 Tax=Hyalella azteca TaxID=294128 RepID=A0A8B7NV36_HYAAZ|nr:protein strawberry notch homolog 1 isoform X2 [Hyalella azteca]
MPRPSRAPAKEFSASRQTVLRDAASEDDDNQDDLMEVPVTPSTSIKKDGRVTGRSSMTSSSMSGGSSASSSGGLHPLLHSSAPHYPSSSSSSSSSALHKMSSMDALRGLSSAGAGSGGVSLQQQQLMQQHLLQQQLQQQNAAMLNKSYYSNHMQRPDGYMTQMQQLQQRGMGGLMASLLGAQNPGVSSGLGGLGGLGSLGAAASMSGMLGMAAAAGGPRPGFDMSNPVMAQLMLQQAMSMAQTGAPQMQKLLGMYPGMGMAVNPLMMSQPQQEEEDDDEDMGVAETYADYMPTKLKVGRKHPDQVVETASMSSVEPPDVWYELDIPAATIDQCKLSALQLESIVYAAQQHSHMLPDGTRAGFLVGDGAGVGKGRTIAGIIFENFLKGRKKALWVSVSNDLKYDAERDLKDIGVTNIPVHFLSKMKYAKINSSVNGNIKKGVMFSTYSALIGESSSGQGKYKTRLKQLLNWCGDDFDGCIIFDECHRAKNLCPAGSAKPTKTGLTVLELQNKLPKARVVYASATGASEPKNMAYMVRLGIWGLGTPFPEFNDFIAAVEKRGVGAMEIVAMDMKLRGSYIARQLSFNGVTFRIEEVMLDEDFKRMYDESVKLWVEARQMFQEASELVDAEKGMKKTMWGQFWSSHQRFFKYLCIGAKVEHTVRLARDACLSNRCVVIGLQSTGEARTLEQLEKDDGELSDFVSTAKGVLECLVEKHFPCPDRMRMSRMLGLPENSKELKDIMDESCRKARQASPPPSLQHDDKFSPSPGRAKRKPVRQAAQRAKRRYKEAVAGHDSDDSDFEVSGSSSVEEEEDDFSSNVSSDFTADSDMDDEDVWEAPKKRGRPPKPKVKNGRPPRENGIKKPPLPQAIVDKVMAMRTDLLSKITDLGRRLPPNTLDQLIDELGGPEKVAEMTGRKGRVVQTDGNVVYESRSEQDVPLEILNIKEKERFMNGEKLIAIISEAASSGISLQSDRRVKNQRRRVHITLELPWSADRAIQQFGRTHRSNQVNGPEYVFLISELAGERRFASIVAKRLESLGALTHGDRRATETRDLSSFNIDNKYGRLALESTMKTMMGYEHPIVPPPDDYDGDFFSDLQNALVGVGTILKEDNVYQLDKDYNNMSKFLNRILGMPVDLQNRLFKYFTDTLAAIVTQAKKTGKYDMGIMDLGMSGEGCKRTKTRTWVGKHSTGTAKTDLHTVLVERGLSWEQAMEKFEQLSGDLEGFYVSHQVRNNKKTAVLAVCETEDKNTEKKDKNSRLFVLYRPNTGLQMKQEPYSDLKKKYKKVKAEDAKEHWEGQFNSSSHTCSHAYWQGNCRRVSNGLDCEIGLRRRTYHVLCGSVLNVWSRVEEVLSSGSANHHQTSKMQVLRLKTVSGLKLVGTLIPNNLVERLASILDEYCTDYQEEEFQEEEESEKDGEEETEQKEAQIKEEEGDEDDENEKKKIELKEEGILEDVDDEGVLSDDATNMKNVPIKEEKKSFVVKIEKSAQVEKSENGVKEEKVKDVKKVAKIRIKNQQIICDDSESAKEK